VKSRKYFPLGKAYGKAFCNRQEEIKILSGNVESGKHTFLAAPRRYGKSSLCEAVIERMKRPSTKVDLHVATSERSIERILLKGVIDLVGEAISSVDKALKSIQYKLKNLKPKVAFAAGGAHLELEIINKSSAPETIREAILFLDKLLAQKKQEAVMLIDEFQRVAEIAPDMGIEGGIRSAAQETTHLALIFSGSNRRLIESIFQDEGRPLYKLCKKIRLERIARNHYKKHLNNTAKLMWNQELPERVFSEIMKLTERHPYYVNYLCDSIWSLCDNVPTVSNIKKIWSMVIDEERSDLLKEFYSISDNPKKLLIYLATQTKGKLNDGLYSIQAAKKMGMPTTSIKKALNILLAKDIIEEIGKGNYQIINPAYQWILCG